MRRSFKFSVVAMAAAILFPGNASAWTTIDCTARIDGGCPIYRVGAHAPDPNSPDGTAYFTSDEMVKRADTKVCSYIFVDLSTNWGIAAYSTVLRAKTMGIRIARIGIDNGPDGAGDGRACAVRLVELVKQ